MRSVVRSLCEVWQPMVTSRPQTWAPVRQWAMASLLQPDRVVYLVRGEKRIRASLSQLYFCRYCSELRSLECVSHEVRSHFPHSVVDTLLLVDLLSGWQKGGTCPIISHIDWLSFLSVIIITSNSLISLDASMLLPLGLALAKLRQS